MSDQQELSLFSGEQESSDKPKDFAEDLYKKWTKAGGVGRFLTLRTWLEAGKISIDVGETGGDGLKSNTQVWANAVSLTTYAIAVRNGYAPNIYKEESFLYYGGGKSGDSVVSRVLKVVHWTNKDGAADTAAFAWKTGHFHGRLSDTGAVIPDMKRPISMSSIKVTRQEMAEIATMLELALINHASHTAPKQWIKELTGKNR